MSSKIFSIAYSGLHCQLIEVEADVSRHLPGFILVGLPDTAVQEAKERIRSALDNSDLPFPRTKVTVNLAPADVRKEGSLYDLAIAVSILCAEGIVTLSEQDAAAVFLGELSLSGELRPIRGALLAASYVRERGIRRMYVPEANAREASYMAGVEVMPVRSLKELVEHLSDACVIAPQRTRRIPAGTAGLAHFDFSEVHGQHQAKRALEIAAAGGHNVLLNGIPGSGKTMLAKSFVSILPPPSPEEILEVSKIYSCSGLLIDRDQLIRHRPFRSPHHTASVASIVGGGTWPKPGEITLAHRGVLFLDEFPEFPRSVLEALRQPLEDRVVSISRVAGSLQFPAHFILIAAQNPCPCGAWGDREKVCTCSEWKRIQYQRKISGPLLDRIDLHVRVFAVKRDQLLSDASREASSVVLGRVAEARALQHKRVGGTAHLNGSLSHAALKRHCVLAKSTQTLLIEASKKLQLSARSFYKIIKISRTIADLAGHGSIADEHVLEALQYRAVNE